MFNNPYAILGITPAATRDEVKRAFHKLAHKYHPDKPTGNADKFKQVSAAYAMLKDAQHVQQRESSERGASNDTSETHTYSAGFNWGAFTHETYGYTEQEIDAAIQEMHKREAEELRAQQDAMYRFHADSIRRGASTDTPGSRPTWRWRTKMNADGTLSVEKYYG